MVESQGKPERFKISKIGEMIGMLSLIEKYLDKMDKTKEFIEENSESIEEFQLRKIKWAINKLEIEGKEAVKWRILKKAGIKGNYNFKI